MGATTGIGWTGATWNPTVGCTKVSPGCDRCYAETFVNRRGHPAALARAEEAALTARAQNADEDAARARALEAFPTTFDHVSLRSDRFLLQPLRWRKPRLIFVNSLSDLFHDDVPDEFIAEVWAVMSIARRHTFQVLTKRHARMRSLTSSFLFRIMVNAARMRRGYSVLPDSPPKGPSWPLRNVWLGVSVENQQWADIRIPALLNTPAAVRFLSCEPLLGPVDLHAGGDGTYGHWLPDPAEVDCDGAPRTDPLCQAHGMPACNQDPGCTFVDWVIVGGESGPGARPMDVGWAGQLAEQCAVAGVPFFFKQTGTVLAKQLGLRGSGDDPAQWPTHLSPELWRQDYPERPAA